LDDWTPRDPYRRGRRNPREVLNVLKKLIVVPVVAAVLGATGCALQVRTDANTALVHACHSFDWAGSFQGNSSLRTTIANPLNESRLRAAIAAHLNSMGVTQASGKADCLIGYGIGAHNVIVGPGPYAYGWGWGWPGPFWGGGVGWYGPDVVREGVIGVDIYDGASREPMWHASVDQDLTGTRGPEAEKRINAAVQAIFAKYPG
jgi:hypothetical protein